MTQKELVAAGLGCLGVLLTIANVWAIWIITDLKSDIREIRKNVPSDLNGHIDKLDSRIANLVSSNATALALTSPEGQKLSAAIFETRVIVERVQATENGNKDILTALQNQVGRIAENVNYMRGELSHAPWIKK